jgi:carbonic anhydrase
LPDIQSFKGFTEFMAKNLKGQVKENTTVRTVDSYYQDFVTALSRQGRIIPENISTTIREVI